MDLQLGVIPFHKNKLPMPERFWVKAEKQENGCWLWTSSKFKHNNGYQPTFWLDGQTRRATRVAYILAKGEIPEGQLVCHSCDEPMCVNPDHLWLGSCKDNLDDMRRKKRERYAFGEISGQAKLTEHDVRGIKIMLTKGWSQSYIAEQFGVSQTNISQIKLGKTWGHVK